MTKLEVETLVRAPEGRVCIRMFRRSDGTVLTADCPVGLRAVRKRVTRFAGASLAAILGLFSVSFGQKADEKIVDASKSNILRTVNGNEGGAITGTLSDPNGAVIPGASLRIWNNKTDRQSVSNADGFYTFFDLIPGVYNLTIKTTGFTQHRIKGIAINSSEKIQLNVDVEVSKYTENIGVLVDVSDIEIDPTSSTVQTKITARKINLIPHK